MEELSRLTVESLELEDGTRPPFSPPVRVDVSGLSHPGKVRAHNEDHFIVMRLGRYLETVLTTLPAGEVPERADEAGYALVVADGMGGHADGELASRMAISGLVKLVLAMPDWIFHLDARVAGDAKRRSKGRFRSLNSLLIEHGRRDHSSRGMGTTLTAARIMGHDLHVVHVGDSRAYMLRERRLHRLTRDHTFVQLLIDSGQMSPEEGAHSSQRHLLVNALGGYNPDVEVDVDQVRLASGDRLLLCSDGLTDMVDDEAIRAVLVDCSDSAGACRRLIDLALENGGRDNITAIVASCTFS
jgi:protein phosphatase